MRRSALYSRSSPAPVVAPDAPAPAPERARRRPHLGAALRHPGALWAAVLALALALGLDLGA